MTQLKKNSVFISSHCWGQFVGLMALMAVLNPTLNAQQSTLYQAGKVITVAGETLSPGMVLVQDGKIVSIAGIIEDASAKQIDFGPNSVLMPGLVDAYSQIGLTTATRDEMTMEVTPTFSIVNGIDWKQRSMQQALANGTTTACITPGTENVIAGLAAIIKTSTETTSSMINADGPLVINLCSDPTRRNQSRQRPDSIYVRQPTNRMGVVWITRSSFDQARQSSAQVELNPLRDVVQGQRSLLVVSRTAADLETAFTLGDEFDFKPILVGGQESYRLVDRIAESGTAVILTPVPTGVTSGPERTEICLNRAGLLADAGVSIALSGEDLLSEARFAVRHGLDRDTALAAITATPAKILGLEGRIGSLQPGRDADFVVLAGDPLEFTTPITHIVVEGRLIAGEQPASSTPIEPADSISTQTQSQEIVFN